MDFTAKDLKALANRALRTAAQTFVAVAGLSETVTGVLHVNWLAGLQAGFWAAVAAVVMYIAFPPETK